MLLQSQFSILYELTFDKNAIITQIIDYNGYYLTFSRPLDDILTTQLHTL
jgi:hypothetical protein